MHSACGLIKMKISKKADMGWGFVVMMIIGLMVLLALIFVAINAKNGFSNMFGQLGELFG